MAYYNTAINITFEVKKNENPQDVLDRIMLGTLRSRIQSWDSNLDLENIGDGAAGSRGVLNEDTSNI